MSFKFFRKNYAFTTTQLLVSTGSGTVANIFDRDKKTKWQSVGESADADTATISFVPGSSTMISGIMVLNHNWKNFNIIFNSGTAFSPALSVTGNTLSNLFYQFASQAVNSIDINVSHTHSATNKSVAELIISDFKFELISNPNFSSYTPSIRKKGIEQELADGGMVSIFLSEKFQADIDLSFVDTATAESLQSLYNEHSDFVFVPFPPATFTASFDGQAWGVNWLGGFNFMMLRSNILANGYRGSMKIAQIPD